MRGTWGQYDEYQRGVCCQGTSEKSSPGAGCENRHVQRGASLGRPVSVPGKTCHLKQDLNDSWHFKR